MFRPHSYGFRRKGTGGPRFTTATIDSLTVTNGITAGGAIDAVGGVTGRQEYFPVLYETNAGPLPLTAGKAIAKYLGRAPKTITSMELAAYIHGTAAAGAGYAEIAIATGAIPAAQTTASINLTAVAYASVDAEAKAGATALANKTLSGFTIPRDTDMWAIVACSYATTQMSLRYATGNGGAIAALIRTRTSYQPSVDIGVARAFAYTIGEAAPILTARVA